MKSIPPVYTWDNLWTNISKPFALIFLCLQITGFIIFGFQLLIFLFKGITASINEYKRFLITVATIIVALGIIYPFSFVRPETHAIIILYPLSVIFMCFCLQFFMAKGFIKIGYIISFFSLITLYYISIVISTSLLPDLGYREKAIKAIETKNSNVFELHTDY